MLVCTQRLYVMLTIICLLFFFLKTSVYYSKRANGVFSRYWNKKCKSLASMHRMNSVPFLCVSRSVMMAFSPHLTSVLPMYDVITNQLAGESFIIEVFELLFHPPMPPHVLDTFCALGSQGTGRNNPKTNTHTHLSTQIYKAYHRRRGNSPHAIYGSIILFLLSRLIFLAGMGCIRNLS